MIQENGKINDTNNLQETKDNSAHSKNLLYHEKKMGKKLVKKVVKKVLNVESM